MKKTDIKSKDIVPNVLYIAYIDDRLILGKNGTHLMGVFLPTLRSAIYMDLPGSVEFTEDNIHIEYISLQRFLNNLGKGQMESLLLAYSFKNKDAVVYMHPLWRHIVEKLPLLINFDLYGVASTIYKYLRHFEYTQEYINELKQLRKEIQGFDRDDSISDILDLIDWTGYRIIRPYRIRKGENHRTQKGIDLLGRKIQDVRVDVLIDRIDMDLGDYYRRHRQLTPEVIKKVFTAIYLYGHLTFHKEVFFPLPKLLQDILNNMMSNPTTECLRCLYMKFSFIDDIDIQDNMFYIHARQIIETFYQTIYHLDNL